MLPPIRRSPLSPAARAVAGRIAMAGAGIMAMLLAAAAAAHPAEADTAVVLRHVDSQPRTPAAARRLLRRIERAQAEACGASPFSLAPYRAAILHGACFREGMARTVAQIGSQPLSAAYAQRRMPEGGR